jgi:hypothetical protein
LSKTRT